MIQSIDRAMAIIHILISDPYKREWSISDLSERAELPISTMHRILSSLIKHRLVTQNPVTKHYRVGYFWMEVGMQVLESIDFRGAAQPVMENLAKEVEESIYLNIQDGTFGITIEIVDSPLKVRIAETVGTRIPLYIGAPNKAILSFLMEDEREQILEESELTKEEKESLRESIVMIQKTGYAYSVSEQTEGTASLAAPVFGYGNKVVAAVSINGPSFRITKERMPLLIEKVKKAAEDISRELGRHY